MSDSGEEFHWDTAFELPHGNHAIVFSGFELSAAGIKFEYQHVDSDMQVLHTFYPQVQMAGLMGHAGQTAVAIQQTAVGLGMAVLSYVWMGFCTPVVLLRVKPTLSEEQLAFWREVFLTGLREHFLVNGIFRFGRDDGMDLRFMQANPDDLQKSRVVDSDEVDSDPVKAVSRILVPLGAGKDSSVVWEILRRTDLEKQWFFMEGESGEFERCWRYQAVADISGSKDVIVATFVWCSGPFQRARNRQYAMTGHLWAALVAFAASLAAVAHGFDSVAVGNERSANVASGLIWEGVEVNHQYDKSFEFEKIAHEYIRKNCGGIWYFSALATFWDLQVGLLFAHICPQYLPYIISCNEPKGSNQSRWCANCWKCAFVAAIFAAFFPAERVWAIFGDDPFEVDTMITCLDELTAYAHQILPVPARARVEYVRKDKSWTPFECVGTPEEVKLCLLLAMRRYQRRGWRLPRFFSKARCEALGADCGLNLELLNDRGPAEHLLPPCVLHAVEASMAEALLAHSDELAGRS